MYASVKIQLRLAYLYITAMTNGYLPINIFFRVFQRSTGIANLFTDQLTRDSTVQWKKHGQNEKEFEWLRGINVSALDRNELIFHRASERRCIDAKNPEGRWKCARRICKRSRATKTRCTGNVSARRGARTQSPVTKARRWWSLRHGPKRRLLTEKQESGGIIMSRLQYCWRV